MSRRHTVHAVDGFLDSNDIPIRCQCGRIATWRRRRTGRAARHECSLCRVRRIEATR